MPAAGLPKRDARPEVATRDDDAPGQRDVRVGEVADRPVEVPAAALVAMHVRTIGLMSEDVNELLPGTGEIMQSVGTIWWKCAHAGRGGNWELAAYFARRTQKLLRKLAVIKPKYADDIAAFEATELAAVFGACQRRDRASFDAAITAAIDTANDLHVKWAHAYLRYRLPEEPPTDLDLTP